MKKRYETTKRFDSICNIPRFAQRRVTHLQQISLAAYLSLGPSFAFGFTDAIWAGDRKTASVSTAVRAICRSVSPMVATPTTKIYLLMSNCSGRLRAKTSLPDELLTPDNSRERLSEYAVPFPVLLSDCPAYSAKFRVAPLDCEPTRRWTIATSRFIPGY